MLGLIVVASLLSAAGVWFTASLAGGGRACPRARRWSSVWTATWARWKAPGCSIGSSRARRRCGRSIDAIGRAKTDRRVKGAGGGAGRRRAVLGPQPGGPRRHPRLPQVRQEDDRLPRVRRRAGVLPRHGVREGGAPAVERARPQGPRHLRGVPARGLRQGRRDARLHPHRRLQDGDQHLHPEDLHAGAPRDDDVAEPRRLRSAGAGDRGGPQEVARDGPGADRRGAVHRRGRARGRARRRPAVSRRGRGARRPRRRGHHRLLRLRAGAATGLHASARGRRSR